MKVIFVGDRPSTFNDDQDVAFVGTRSFTNLCKWIAKMQIDDFTMVNSYAHQDFVKICQIFNEHNGIWVALGNRASKRLDKMGIDHHKLPHPSPSNRMLNDEKLIDSRLEKCYLYIKEQNRKCASFVPNGKRVS